MATVTRRPTGTVNAGDTALHLKVNANDQVNRYYLSAEATGQTSARSPVFQGDYEWEGWIPPAQGSWTVHLRRVSDNGSAANLAVTVAAPA